MLNSSEKHVVFEKSYEICKNERRFLRTDRNVMIMVSRDAVVCVGTVCLFSCKNNNFEKRYSQKTD